ncbi:DUF697 domain-containing protein [Acidisphaera sp. S103]|uniref:DUF697 domain-containing protein n=1 Tax=Acidisphaera sp. S103 TaxID=1747223 RepID=UPI00131E1973|nr:DUF697 domain-containing protein [Acidisphaera sp. S103]
MSDGPRFLDEHGHDEPSASMPNSAHGLDRNRAIPEPPAGPMLLKADPALPNKLPDLQSATAINPPTTRVGTGLLITFGLMGLLTTWVAISIVSFVMQEFRVALALGVVTSACFVVSLALLMLATARELRAWQALSKVGRLRRVLSANLADRDNTLGAALDWLILAGRHLPEASQTQIVLQEAGSAAEIRALVRLKIVAPLEASATLLGKNAAMQSAALIAICPHKGLEGLIAGGRGVLLIRQIAVLYGLRPGLAVTISLLRHVAWTAVGTAGVTELTENVVSWTTTDMPFVKHIAGALGGSAVDAVRMIRLARAASRACCPVAS